MKFFAALAMAAMAVAAPTEKRAPTPLDVKLELVGNSEVKATVTNTGKNNLKLFSTGTFLDDAPVEKVSVLSGDKPVTFDGVKLLIATENLEEDAFTRLDSGESLEVTFDIAEYHDLSAGGAFKISSEGAFSFAEADSTELVGSVPFTANTVEAKVDGASAAAVHTAFVNEKRTRVQSDCSGTRLSQTRSALSGCASWASQAQSVAQSGSATKMTEYFKSSSSSTRSTVAGVFSRMRSECSSTSGGASTFYCSDFYGVCGGGVIAYTVPSLSAMAYCPLHFSLPLSPSSCYGNNQIGTVVHEVTHLSQIAGTDDFGGYGYNFVRSLSASQNLRHADTYALFAQSIIRGC
ncbi:Deuterolysin metalloprotease family-domain-containing protein [Emericellopsis atlantica]|uniref:Neutral protease 2 n=1 Tax=Emericellopsis atlantica TaxID=2614577 RepID=A0A9P8CNE4_9HYPO|nr:Deuterolysin metalloprotease family-domain-containing protein [Emericellopsis atlantica]KAG9253438.1 Deuterolysin metalloprotease family-domain-containing protein [Emericellopsis atlantica]